MKQQKKPTRHARLGLAKKTIIAASIALALGAPRETFAVAEPQAFTVAQAPLFLASPLPNVLFLLDNSNSFDERADGVPVGSNHLTSKSVIARTSLRSIVANYEGQINLGLMTYKIGTTQALNLTPALYDASYDPSTYDPTYTDAKASAQGWEAFPYSGWGTYTGTYNTAKTCAAPYACPWNPLQGQPHDYAGFTWDDTPYTGERRGKAIQYANFGDTSPWHQHPYDFIYYNLMQASYSGSMASYNPPGGAVPPPSTYCYSNNTSSLHGASAGAPGGIGGNAYKCRWTKTAPLPTFRPDGVHNAAGAISTPNNGPTQTSYGFGATGYDPNYVTTDSDQAQGFTSFGRIIVDLGNTQAATLDIPAAPTFYQANAVGIGHLRSPIAPLTSAKVTALNSLLQCRIPATWSGGAAYTPPANAAACSASGVVNAGATPSPGALQSALRYFQGALTNEDNGAGVSLSSLNTVGVGANNMPNSCGKNYMIFFTDGMPTHNPAGVLYATPAAALADTVAAATALKTAGVFVYVIGFGNAVQQTGLDQIAAAGGTTTAFVSSDAASVDAALAAVFNDVIVRSASAASVATNSAQFSVNTSIFQARFTTADWSGQLLKYQTDNTNGAVAANPEWDSGAALDTQAWSHLSAATDRRQIVAAARPSLTDSVSAIFGGTVGVPFVWPANPAEPTASELRPWQIAAMNKNHANTSDAGGQLRTNWMRGDRSNEGLTVSTYRRRLISVLGDIANSYPLFVGAPASTIASGSDYFDFRQDYKNRRHVIAAGANDGMLHLFDAENGKEVFAFVPSNTFGSNISATGASRLSQFMRQDYKNNHVYTVDGSPVSEDVHYGGAWHTVLASGAGAGGQNYFALNITNTSNDATKPDPALTEANASQVVLWEFGDKNLQTGTLNAAGVPTGVVNGDADLGYAFAKPLITLANNNKWVAIFGNGYNNRVVDGSQSTTGRAALYVVDIQTGALIRKIPVPVGTTSIANGLGSARGLDDNLDGKTDYAYAGDLYGNLWKFNLTSTDPAQWSISFSGLPLFTITGIGAAANRRPITGEIRVTPHPSGGHMVLFGSGRYLATAAVDTPASYDATNTDALYSVWDSGSRVTNGRSWLNGQLLQNATPVSGNTYRQLTSNATTSCSYGATPATEPGCTMGCYIDLTDFPNAGNNGERFTFFPQLRSGLASFNTIIPSTDMCSAGGNTEQVIFNYLTCSSDSFSPFDVNGDDAFTAADLIEFVPGTPKPAGSKILAGITPPGTRVQNPANGQIYVYNSSSLGGKPTQDKLRFNGRGGRVSWRPLQKNPKH